MNALLQGGAAVCTLLGVLSGVAVLARSRDLRLAVGVLLEFLLAAGLLRLVDEAGWRQLASAAVVVAAKGVLPRARSVR